MKKHFLLSSTFLIYLGYASESQKPNSPSKIKEIVIVEAKYLNDKGEVCTETFGGKRKVRNTNHILDGSYENKNNTGK